MIYCIAALVVLIVLAPGFIHDLRNPGQDSRRVLFLGYIGAAVLWPVLLVLLVQRLWERRKHDGP